MRRVVASCVGLAGCALALLPALAAAQGDAAAGSIVRTTGEHDRELETEGESEQPQGGGLNLQLGVGTWVLAAGDYAVSVADQELRASTGIGVGLSAELLDPGVFGGGLTLSFLRRPSDDIYLSDTLLTHLGLQAGPRVLIGDRLLLGASAMVGLHVLSFRDAEELSFGLGAGAAGLVEVRMTDVLWLKAQLGVLSQPLGGHAASDVTFAPTPLAILGFSVLLPPRY